MKTFAVSHDHRFGTSVYAVQSDLDLTQPDEEGAMRMCKDLGIGYEPEKNEGLTIEPVEVLTWSGP